MHNRFLDLLMEKERTERRRISQSEVAREVKVANHTIANWMRDEVMKYEAPIVERLCDYFQCDLGDLLYFEYVESDDEGEGQTEVQKAGE